MGNLYIPIKAMLQYLGLDVVVPPPSSKKTLNLGVKHGPEFACMPLKLNLGNFIEAREMGADTIIMAGGCGPCRFGYYAQIEHAILKDIGCDMQLIVLEPPEKNISELIVNIKRITGSRSWWQVIQAVRFGYRKALAVDEVEKAAFQARPRELRAGDTDHAYNEALKLIDAASSPGELAEAREKAGSLMAGVARKHSGPVVRIGIIGEIYTLLEPFSNHRLEKQLGQLGVEVDRSIYLSEWVNDHLLLGLVKGLRSSKEACSSASPYLCHFVGGHGQETVGSAVNYALAGYDGLIQVYPFTCMPEIVAQSILPDVGADYGIPLLTLIIDEHTGEAGLQTRLEAFIDLLIRRKETREVCFCR
jgi:predicted nucleotide-binding protein (sugar kinase/HSP70/actin superfamily)